MYNLLKLVENFLNIQKSLDWVGIFCREYSKYWECLGTFTGFWQSLREIFKILREFAQRIYFSYFKCSMIYHNILGFCKINVQIFGQFHNKCSSLSTLRSIRYAISKFLNKNCKNDSNIKEIIECTSILLFCSGGKFLSVLLSSLQWKRVPSNLLVRTKSHGIEVILSTFNHPTLNVS